MTLRSPIVLGAGVVLTLSVCCAPVVAAGQPAEPQLLTPGAPVVRELASGQSHAYQIVLDAGQFTVVTAKYQHGAPVLSVTDPAGRQIIERAPSQVSVVAALKGRYLLRVAANDPAVHPGRYELTIEPSRPAGEREIARASGDRLLSDGLSLALQRTATGDQQAIGKFTSALAHFGQAGHRRGEALALLGLGQTYLRRSPTETDRARAYLNDAVELARAIEDKLIEADSLVNLGVAYPGLTERKRALEYYDQALKLFEGLENQAGQAAALSNAGNAWRDLQEHRTALEYFNRALPLANRAGDHAQVARIHNSLGLVHQELGDIPAALGHFSHALPLSRSTGNLQLEYMLLNNTGIAYKQLGDYRKALDSYQQSLVLARKLGNLLSEAQLLNNIGNIHKAEGRYDQSLDTFGQSLSIFRRLKAQGGVAAALNNTGSTYYQLGEYEKALDLHLQSHEIRKAGGDRRGDASSLNNAGLAWHRLSEPAKALACLREALEIRRQTGDPVGEAETLLNIAIVERDSGTLLDARTTLEAALAITEGLRAKITDAALRASYIGRVQDTYASYVDVLMRLHAQSPSAGYDVAALQASERSRARVLLESLVEAREDIRHGVDPPLLERERSLQQKIDAGSERLSRGLSGTSTSAQTAAARNELASLTAEYQQVQAQIRASSPRYAALTQPEPLTAARMQQDVLDDDTVLLEFALGEERSWLWAVTKQTVTSVALPARRDLETAARSLYDELTARQPRAGEAASAYATRVAAADRRLRDRAATVSRLLFGGVAGELQGPWRGKRLAIVAAGALEYLPFAALPLPQSSDQPVHGKTPILLIARHEIIEMASASVLATLRQEAAGRERPRRTVAVLADPVFDAADPRIAQARRRAESQVLATRSPASAAPIPAISYQSSRAVERIGDLRGGGGLARLPFSRDEANAITLLAGRPETLQATDFDASRRNVLGTALGEYRIVHFATHGLIDAERPELSGLVLSLVNDRGAPQDGLLRLADIFNMRLNADLVVLSACQTALGKEIKGEGLVGLTRGFMYAGAPRVVASLWQVSDLATAELMKKFYQGMLQRRLTPAAALRAAQRQMARDPRSSSPYYWAGFVLQGDWR